MYYRSLSMSESSTTLSQVSRERGRVSSVVNERLAVGQRGSGQKAEGQRGRIGLEQEREARRDKKKLRVEWSRVARRRSVKLALRQ